MNIESIAERVEKIDSGYYRATGITENISYTHEGHQKIEKSESESFWFRHRGRCIQAIIRNFPSEAIADVGGGNGKVSRMIQGMGVESLLIEPVQYATDVAWKNGQKYLIQGTMESSGIKAGSLPAIGLFDVLEHIKNDTDFLRQVHTALTPGGILYLTVPAYQFLYSNFDSSVGHFRRYRLRELKDKMWQAGFQVEFASYLFLPLPLPMLIRKMRKQPVAVTPSDHVKTNTFLGKVLLFILSPERVFIQRKWKVPLGSSCILVARKKLV
ncbi:MAG: class I SAM-dependent methyltransferase [Ekhidna sp.]|uniref:class I SAM-dependent methyltransferase n=1 Tax=Ekhidna sp. TaxID=2608089 RepID=UPI0032EEB79C